MSGETRSLEFDAYLKETLIKLNTDDEVFFPYIRGILEGEDSIEEKDEALQGIIAEITDTRIEELCKEILSKWSSCFPDTRSNGVPLHTLDDETLDSKLAKLMEKQASSIAVANQPSKKTISSEHEQLKRAVLAQHAQVAAVRVDDDEHEVEESKNDPMLAKNTNAAAVEQEMRQKREQSKLEHKVKKEKDKTEREKQKLKAEERKDKEKKRTQKGERKR
ncbi:hypothetical protein FHG87_012075 [Trinorchestia longiramus]|nr:hypothetical protein FHG87_012075 [Trinorchestia longiramus]